MRTPVLSLAVVSIAIGLAATPPAGAADRSGRFAAKGPGQATCGQILQAIQDERDRFLFLGWIQGFVTGMNAFQSNTFDLIPAMPENVLADLLIRQCEQNPEVPLMQVMLGVADQLRAFRLEEQTEVVTVETDAGSMQTYRGILRLAQQQLKAGDLYPGGIDGVYGPQTQASFEAFQEQANLEVTGLPDLRTLLALFYNIILPDEAAAAAPAAEEGAAEDSASDGAPTEDGAADNGAAAEGADDGAAANGEAESDGGAEGAAPATE